MSAELPGVRNYPYYITQKEAHWPQLLVLIFNQAIFIDTINVQMYK